MNESILRSSQQDRDRYRAMVVTDLDGTLLNSSASLSAANRDTLCRLGEQGVLRVVATGRNLYSARLAMTPDMPVDYLVFASGAGTLAWPDGELSNVQHLDDGPAGGAAAYLL
jgi:hydroxymethylpyrimidine pyrophosphatase-like HAD family hydrolase